jgi:myosin heavy subunit
LSTLTKVLIVLLSVFSLFLCGIVATYVASADNFRQKANDTQRQLSAARETQNNAVRVSEGKDAEVKAIKADLGTKLNDLEALRTKLTAELEDTKRLNSELQQKLMSLNDRMVAADAAVKQQTALYDADEQKLHALEADRINREKELTETSETLLQKVTLIAQLQDTVRQLTQENQDLGTRLNQYLVQYGKIATRPPTTVAPGSAVARPVQPIAAAASLTKDIALNGQVTQVDAQNRLVQISIGTAAGVRQKMTFHLTRGDQYVADILIIEVWPDQAVGTLDVVKEGMQPQAGDKVSTNL